jgi:beta-ribofuranosylaminobenzene 5'-phosphate synthase
MQELNLRQSLSPSRVRIQAPARLHLGFMDLNGGLGRRYGSLGLALEGLFTRIQVERATTFLASGACGERALGYAKRLFGVLDLDGGVRIQVQRAIPQHAGLGSGTQLAVAVGVAIDRLHGLGLGARRIAYLQGRGVRSGIGIGAFDGGGFMVDGGHGPGEDELPPVIVRMGFPEHWRVLLVFDTQVQGLYGRPERSAFEALPGFEPRTAERLCRLVMMQILPALSRQDLHPFAQGIGELQSVVGDYFTPAQGGCYTSAAVAQVLAWLQAQGIEGLGQSSWGPTGFAVLDSEMRAFALLREVQMRFGAQAGLRFAVLRARNRGATIEQTLPQGGRRPSAEG